jgi:hypothetical protein
MVTAPQGNADAYCLNCLAKVQRSKAGPSRAAQKAADRQQLAKKGQL